MRHCLLIPFLLALPALSQAIMEVPELPVMLVQPDDSTDGNTASTTRLRPDAGDPVPRASMQDLSARAVSLQASTPHNRNTGIFVRGLGTTGFNDGMSGSVGLTQDGVHLGRQGMFPVHLYDIEAVDIVRTPVLAGPGPATSAGALHVRSKAPERHREARIRTTLGSDGLRRHETVVGGGLDNGELAARLSAYTHRRDGTTHNRSLGRDVNGESHEGLRGQLLWQPSPTLRARLIVEGNRLDDDCCGYSVAQYSNATRARAAALGHALLPADPHSRTIAQDGTNRRRMDQDSATLQLEFVLPNDSRLVGITGWRHWRFDGRSDLDGIDLPIAPLGVAKMNHRQWSQEIRLEGAFTPRLGYRVGAYYLDQSHRREGRLTYGPTAARWFTAGMALPPINDALLASIVDGATVSSPGRQSASTHALFGQLDWSPVDAVDLSGTLRYSRDRKRGSVSRHISGLQPLPSLPGFDALAASLRGMLVGRETQQHSAMRDDSLDLALRAGFDARPGLRFELGASTGYKPGGINGETVTGSVQPTFDAEHSLNLEASAIVALPAAARLRMTAFRTDVRDYQALTYNPESSPLIPQMNNITNVDRVRTQGLEIESSVALARTLRLNLGAGYNDARYASFRNAPCPPGTGVLYCDLDGKQMANAPRWTAFAQASGHHPLSEGRELFGAIGYQWRSGYYGTTERGRGSYVDARGIVDAHIGLRHRHWEVSLWAQNLTDKRYTSVVYALNGGGDYGALAGPPRTIGISLQLSL